MKLTITNWLAIGLIVSLLVVAVSLLLSNASTVLGSVGVSDEYIATSTAPNGSQGAFAGQRLIKQGQGVLGSMVITGAGTAPFCFYDATTTAITLRASSKATSTITIACFPASTAVGTYTFDSRFNDGLFLAVNPNDLGTGTMATSTVTYRNQ